MIAGWVYDSQTMANSEAPMVWRHHHNGGLQMEAKFDGGKWLQLPWSGKRIKVVYDHEEMRGKLREVAIDEATIERLMTWLYGTTAETAVPVVVLDQSFV